MRDFLVGGFVISKAGHDKDEMYVITDIQGDFLMLANGKTKTVDDPKKKKKKHVMFIDKSIDASHAMTNELIKHEIKQYINHQTQG